MHIARILDRIEHATLCHWWLLLIFLMVSLAASPTLALFWAAIIAIVVWLDSEHYAHGGAA